MKTFVNSLAMLGFSGALMLAVVASQVQAAEGFTNYYLDGAYSYENSPASRTANADRVVPSRSARIQPHAYESFAAEPRSFGGPVRPYGAGGWWERHVNGTE